MVFLRFSWVFPSYSYGLPKTQRPTMTDGSLTETDGKTLRLTVTDRNFTETDGSLTNLHGRGGQWSGRRRAVVRGAETRWILGLCRGRCAGVPVCRCAGVQVCRVQVCRCAGDRGNRGGVPIYRCANASVDFAMISLQLSYAFAIII